MTKEELRAAGKKVLTLQMTREYFYEVLEGRQKVEHRNIYPNNYKQYVTKIEEGAQCKYYDYLYFINGRRKDAPRMFVEVVDADFVIITDENGIDQTYIQDGVEYLVCQVWYHLGKVIYSENV